MLETLAAQGLPHCQWRRDPLGACGKLQPKQATPISENYGLIILRAHKR